MMRYPISSNEELRAPKAQFRVVAVDLGPAAETTYVVGDFDHLEAANVAAEDRAGVGNPVYVYNDAGEVVVRFGSWH